MDFLNILSLSPQVHAEAESYIPTTRIFGFDCARRSMGVAVVDIDPYGAALPGLAGRPIDCIDTAIAELRAYIYLLRRRVDTIISLVHSNAWDLGADLRTPEAAAVPLRQHLEALDRDYGRPDHMAYEFQMVQNDKSRMISTMLAYHYAGVPTSRIMPAVKNTFEIRGITPEMFAARTDRKSPGLRHSDFLRTMRDPYAANKAHTAAMLVWWRAVFGVSDWQTPRGCEDDAADAFFQILAHICRECEPKSKTKTKKLKTRKQ